MTTINEEEESGDISSKTTTTLSTPPTQVDTDSATDDDNDNVDADTPSVVETPTTAEWRSRVHYQERNKDLPFATTSAVNLKLDTVYGNHVHANSGSHLHGGIGAREDTLWQARHKSLLPFNAQFYDTLKGKAGKEYTNKIANILESVMKRECNSEQLMVFIVVVMQKAKGVTGSADIQKRILLRITQWRDGKIKGLVEDTL